MADPAAACGRRPGGCRGRRRPPCGGGARAGVTLALAWCPVRDPAGAPPSAAV